MHEPNTYKILKEGKATDPHTILVEAKKKIKTYDDLAQRCKKIVSASDNYEAIIKYTGIAARAMALSAQYKILTSMFATEGMDRGNKATAFYKSFEQSLEDRSLQPGPQGYRTIRFSAIVDRTDDKRNPPARLKPYNAGNATE